MRRKIVHNICVNPDFLTNKTSNLEYKEKVLLMIICSLSESELEEISYDHFYRITNMSEKAIKFALRKLHDLKYINIVREKFSDGLFAIEFKSEDLCWQSNNANVCSLGGMF